MRRRTILILMVCIGSFLPFCAFPANGYRALIAHENGFLAVGTGGRIDWIDVSGHLSKSMRLTNITFNAVLRYPLGICVAGDSGTIFHSSDGRSFQKIEPVTDSPIYSLASFKGKLLAGSREGLLLVSEGDGQFRKWQLAVEGNIVSLSARASDCYGVTDKGEILHSEDGIHWTVFDFNTYYAGYYRSCRFTAILAAEGQLAVVGSDIDGAPVLMLSSQGSVWSERTLTYTDHQGLMSGLTEVPYSIGLDVAENQWLLACGKGQVMTVPSCSHCNKLFTVSTETIRAIAQQGTTRMCVGDDFQCHVLQTR